MRRFKVTVYVLSIVLCWNLASAQQGGKSDATVPQHLQNLAEKSQASSRTTQPSTELQSLIKALSGKWTVNIKFESNPKMPNGFSGTGEETWRPGPGNFTLLDEERLPTPAGDIFLLGIIWWDGKTNSFHGMECNNQLPYTCDLKGGLNDVTMTWDGKQFIINEWETHDGKKTLWHEIWSDITPTSFIQTGDIEVPGGTTTRFFTMKATRTKDAGQ